MNVKLCLIVATLSAPPSPAVAGCQWWGWTTRQTPYFVASEAIAAPDVQPHHPAPPSPQIASQAHSLPSVYASALAVINAERARFGRPPLAWSASLAGFAARNSGVHALGSSGGAGQCWAGVSDPVRAAWMWLQSPPHRAILMGASRECGISSCLTGMTANAR